ncbi:MAG: DUF2270 domain-containing protein [Rhizobiaceae bacterium]
MSEKPLSDPGFGLPSTGTERVNALAHFHRAEMGRLSDWRRRIDQTSTWAITVVAAMLSVSLSTRSAHHGVLIFSMVILLLLLGIEARRYRFFDVYRARVRVLERHYFAQMFDHKVDDPDWEQHLAESLRRPTFLMSTRVALGRRLRRTYIWMYAIVLFAWGLKLASPRLQFEGLSAESVLTLQHFIENAAVGPVPGWLVLALVAIFYVSLLVILVSTRTEQGELAHGDAHM